MNNHFMDTSNIFPFTHILFLLLLIQPQEGSSDLEFYYQTCGNSFTCGENITNITYPFRGINDPPYCGYSSLVLTCNDTTRSTSIEIASMNYTVLEINPWAQTMVIARQDVAEEGLTCPQEMANTTLDQTLFEYNTSDYTYITFLYDCPDVNIPGSPYVSCGNRRNVRVLPGKHGPGDCNKSVVVLVSVDVVSGEYVNTTVLDRVLRKGFEVRYNVNDEKKCGGCVESKGRCGINLQTNQTTCFCAGPPYVSDTCDVVGLSSPPVDSPGPEKKLSQTRKDRSHRARNIAAYIGGAVVACVILGCLIFYIKQRKKQRSAAAQTLNKEIRAIPSSKKALISPHSTSFSSITPPSSTSSRSNLGRSCSYFGVHVFDYTELERATNNFDSSRELGDGGFGTVYYGLLPDGREVAIKLLYEHNFRRVEQFMNEIKILTKLSHENLVKLHGCTSRRSRELILVYEYVPNGTVADHLHGKLAKPNHTTTLPWPTRLSIAIETARALAYLHKSDIIHRDVKTNNILLDKDFHVKVADFGLSRLFPCNATHVSTAPQGTPGYVDPEYYQCYKVTEKSDVYSFGVVLVELLSSLQAVDVTRSRSDINLSNMAMSRIQGRKMQELFDTSLGFERDGDVRRMMTDVGELAFRCLQQEGEMRPSMREVLESLLRVRDRDDSDDGVCKVEIVDMWIDEEDCGVVNDAVASSSSSDSTPLNPAY